MKLINLCVATAVVSAFVAGYISTINPLAGMCMVSVSALFGIAALIVESGVQEG